MQLFGLTGYPLGHSLSPRIHNQAFARLGIQAEYRLFPTPPEGLQNFFMQVRKLPISGGNITIPHKVAAMQMVDFVTPTGRAIGAINTFYWQNGRLCGENTDVAGFIAPIARQTFTHALVLGAGGAARAVLAGLRALHVPRITLCNRTGAKAQALADEFGVRFMPWEQRGEAGADIIVNATALGMQGEHAGQTPYPREFFKGSGLAYDIVYNPAATRFLQEAARAGWQTEGGLGMFIGQAAAAFELWTGQPMPQEVTAHFGKPNF